MYCFAYFYLLKLGKSLVLFFNNNNRHIFTLFIKDGQLLVEQLMCFLFFSFLYVLCTLLYLSFLNFLWLKFVLFLLFILVFCIWIYKKSWFKFRWLDDCSDVVFSISSYHTDWYSGLLYSFCPSIISLFLFLYILSLLILSNP